MGEWAIMESVKKGPWSIRRKATVKKHRNVSVLTDKERKWKTRLQRGKKKS